MCHNKAIGSDVTSNQQRTVYEVTIHQIQYE